MCSFLNDKLVQYEPLEPATVQEPEWLYTKLKMLRYSEQIKSMQLSLPIHYTRSPSHCQAMNSFLQKNRQPSKFLPQVELNQE